MTPVSTLAVQRDDLGLCQAGIACDVACDIGEVDLRHDVLDSASDEIVSGRAGGEIMMQSTRPLSDPLDREIRAFRRCELEIGVVCRDWPRRAELRGATPDLEDCGHIVRLRLEQKGIGGHIMLADQVERRIELILDGSFPECSREDECNYF